jgi:enediyne biosynthesis thioesterase
LFDLARRLAREAGDDLDLAATGVWTALESVSKLGVVEPPTLVHVGSEADGTVILRTGSTVVFVRDMMVTGETSPTIFAIAVRMPGSDQKIAKNGKPSRVYEYRHLVCLEETNLVGNVYFVNHLKWQGRCREMFLRDHAPSILEELAKDLALVTTRVGCEYLAEVSPFDEVTVRMSLTSLDENTIGFHFDYWRATRDGVEPELVARGDQTVACMRRASLGLAPTPVPEVLRASLEPYT